MCLMRKIEALHEPDILVVSGSLPRQINPEIYRRIIEIARAKGDRVVLDTDGEPLKVGLRAAPRSSSPIFTNWQGWSAKP